MTTERINATGWQSFAFGQAAVAAAASAEAARVGATLSQASTQTPFCLCRIGVANRRTECHRRSAMHEAYRQRSKTRRRGNR